MIKGITGRFSSFIAFSCIGGDFGLARLFLRRGDFTVLSDNVGIEAVDMLSLNLSAFISLLIFLFSPASVFSRNDLTRKPAFLLG
jgi:hypothetical protein